MAKPSRVGGKKDNRKQGEAQQFVLIAPTVLNFRIGKEVLYENTGD
jgi:hypothetical protein